jgi:hypothetical protein
LTNEVGLNLVDTSAFKETVQVMYHVFRNRSSFTDVAEKLLEDQTALLNRAYKHSGFSFVRLPTIRVMNARVFRAMSCSLEIVCCAAD